MSQQQVSQMFNAISKNYDRVNRILSFGIDRKWRKQMIEHLQGTDLSVLDCATGTCDQLLEIMGTNRVKRGVGLDLASEMLKIGKAKVAPFGDRVELVEASATEIPFESGVFDYITMSFGIRNVQGDCLKEIHRVLKSKGRVLILEFSLPKNRLIKACHLFYLRHVLPQVGGWVSKNRDAYRYLNQTIESFPYGDAFLKRMGDAGFVNTVALPLTFGVATLYIGEKP